MNLDTLVQMSPETCPVEKGYAVIDGLACYLYVTDTAELRMRVESQPNRIITLCTNVHHASIFTKSGLSNTTNSGTPLIREPQAHAWVVGKDGHVSHVLVEHIDSRPVVTPIIDILQCVTCSGIRYNESTPAKWVLVTDDTHRHIMYLSDTPDFSSISTVRHIFGNAPESDFQATKPSVAAIPNQLLKFIVATEVYQRSANLRHVAYYYADLSSTVK